MELVVQFVGEEGVVQRVRLTQALRRYPPQPRLESLERPHLRRLGGGGIVGPAGQRLAVAGLARLHRVQALLEDVDVRDQGAEVIGRAGGGEAGDGEDAEAERQKGESRAPRAAHSAAWIWARAGMGPARSSSSM